VTLNTILYDNEVEDAFNMMMEVQDAGVDAIIIQDLAIIEMVRRNPGKIHIPLHASTQCAIRTPEQAVFLENLGFSRLILERELSLEEIRKIREAVSCELEFFVHGALCVCYSGQCYLSEKIAGRSANRGTCIQACRSRYDLTDDKGRTLVKDKALLSLKDYNLRERLEDLAEAGITSFKIEGRLKNISYVRNVVRDYSTALEGLLSRRPGKYVRGSYGRVSGGFAPDTDKTFNRGYTELYLDGTKGKWAAMDAAKSMGE
jgi:putative protease